MTAALATSAGQLAVAAVMVSTALLVYLVLADQLERLRARRHRNRAAALRRGEAWPPAWWLPGTDRAGEVDPWGDRPGAS